MKKFTLPKHCRGRSRTARAAKTLTYRNVPANTKAAASRRRGRRPRRHGASHASAVTVGVDDALFERSEKRTPTPSVTPLAGDRGATASFECRTLPAHQNAPPEGEPLRAVRIKQQKPLGGYETGVISYSPIIILYLLYFLQYTVISLAISPQRTVSLQVWGRLPSSTQETSAVSAPVFSTASTDG